MQHTVLVHGTALHQTAALVALTRSVLTATALMNGLSHSKALLLPISSASTHLNRLSHLWALPLPVLIAFTSSSDSMLTESICMCPSGLRKPTCRLLGDNARCCSSCRYL